MTYTNLYVHHISDLDNMSTVQEVMYKKSYGRSHSVLLSRVYIGVITVLPVLSTESVLYRTCMVYVCKNLSNHCKIRIS